MPAPPGAVVSLYWDGWDTAEPGDYIKTQTGRTYRIEANRIQARGKHAGRQHLTCVVLAADDEPEQGAKVHEIRWYSRNKR